MPFKTRHIVVPYVYRKLIWKYSMDMNLIYLSSVTRCMTSKNDMSMCLFTFIESLERFVFPNNYHEKKKYSNYTLFAIYNIFYVTHIDDGYGIKRNPNMAMVK